jgi:hypothetical protein
MPEFDIRGQVGRQSLAEGANGKARQGNDGALVFIPGSAAYYQLVKDGLVYIAQTAISGVSPNTSIGTTAGAALYNPVDSGKNLVLIRTSVGYISGTLAAGAVSYCVNTNTVAAAVTGTAMSVRNALLGQAAGNVGQALTTATLPAAPTPVRTMCNLTPILASSVVAPWQANDEVNGELVIRPGACVSLQGTLGAGSSSPLVVFSFTWAEVPV